MKAFSLKNVKKYNLNNDKGSTLITVIVVVAFMSILATILIYLVGENYKTKIYDLKTKESFYEAEIVVERLKSSLTKDVIEASKNAYITTAIDYSQGVDENVRATTYFLSFKKEFDKTWDNHWNRVDEDGHPSVELNLKSLFGNDISVTSPDHFTIDVNGRTLDCTISSAFDETSYPLRSTPLSTFQVFDSDKQVVSYYINDFEITVKDKKTDYISVIRTSFQITPPQLNWGGTVTNSDKELDYSKSVKYYNYIKS